MAVKQIVAGSDARDLTITLVRASDGAALNVTTARLQGRSDELRSLAIDVPLTVAGNVCTLAEFGNLVTPAMLGTRASALYTFEVVYTLGSPAKTDRSPRFQREFVRALG